MPNIGDTFCLFVKPANVQNLRERGELWVVPGVAGFGSRRLGQSESGFTFVAVVFGTSATIEAWYNDICEKQFIDTWTIIDDYGVVYESCQIAQVGPLQKSPRLNIDGNGNCRGQCEVSGVFLPRN